MPAIKTIRIFSRSRWLALLVIPLAAWLLCTDFWLPPGASRISLLYGPKTFDQCSRTAPDPGFLFWIPTAAQIREAEAALAPMFAMRRQKGLTMPREHEGDDAFFYRHQYIGFQRGGEALIYLNAYPSYDDEEGPGRRFALLETPSGACDGGRHYWGAVYHPKTKVFDSMEFNGQ